MKSNTAINTYNALHPNHVSEKFIHKFETPNLKRWVLKAAFKT